MIGPLSRDVVDGRAERIGGGPWYAARALRDLRQEAIVAAKCGEPERRAYLRRLAALGLPVSLAAAGETTSFSFRYDADGNREMRVEAIGGSLPSFALSFFLSLGLTLAGRASARRDRPSVA